MVITCAASFCYKSDLSAEAIHTIDFINSMDSLFDTFNSQPNLTEINIEEEPSNSKCFCLPFTSADFQVKFLKSMFEYFKCLTVKRYNTVKNKWVIINKSFNLKFINGWLVSIAGLLRLFQNLQKEHPTEDLVLYTNRLNQDCLENFFGTTRIQNGNCINPTPIQFQRTFKKLFSLNVFEHSEGANCIADLDEILTTINDTPSVDLEALFPEKNPIVLKALPVEGSSYKILDLPEQNALAYVCGYLISKCIAVHNCDTCLNFGKATTNLTSETFYCLLKNYEQDTSSVFGKFMMPDSSFYQYVFTLESIFDQNFTSFAAMPNVGQQLRSLMDNVYLIHPCENFPRTYLINLYLRFKIFSTLNRTNKSIKSLGTGSRSRKLQILSNM